MKEFIGEFVCELRIVASNNSETEAVLGNINVKVVHAVHNSVSNRKLNNKKGRRS